jgi:hypothetical protein
MRRQVRRRLRHAHAEVEACRHAQCGLEECRFTTRWRLIGAVHEDEDTDIQTSRIPAYNYFDETANMRVNDKYTFSLGMLNVFNKKPPLSATAAAPPRWRAARSRPSTTFWAAAFFARVRQLDRAPGRAGPGLPGLTAASILSLGLSSRGRDGCVPCSSPDAQSKSPTQLKRNVALVPLGFA